MGIPLIMTMTPSTLAGDVSSSRVSISDFSAAFAEGALVERGATVVAAPADTSTAGAVAGEPAASFALFFRFFFPMFFRGPIT